MYYKDCLETLKKEYNIRKGKHDQIINQVSILDTEITRAQGVIANNEQVRILLQKTAENARITAKERLETLVTNALRYVFGSDFQFMIELKEHGGKPVAEFYVANEQDGVLVKNKPQDSRGGGIVDIVSLALRIAFLEIHQDPPTRGPIILDEPGKHVDEESAVRLAMFIKEMSSWFKRQIIMVTHQQHLADIADRAFQVELRGDSSKVTLIRNEVSV